MQRNKLRNLLRFGFFFLLLLMQIADIVAGVRLGSDGRADFRTFYVAGHMVRSGQRRDLYNYAIEQTEQDRLASKSATLAFIHPAVEALLFIPFSFLSYRTGYFIFAFVNVLLLMLSAVLLRHRLPLLSKMWRPLPYALFLCFLPAGFAILLGNTQLILLLLLSGASLATLEGDEWIAGLLVGIGILRFQIVLPIALLFLFWRRWKFLGGFAITSGSLALASVMVTGLGGVPDFVHSLSSITLGVASSARATIGLFPGAFPSAMPNLRGLAYGLGLHGLNGIVLAIIGSIAVFGWTCTREASLPLAIVAATLVGFHTHSADLVLLAIPMAFGIENGCGWRRAGALLPLLVSPLYPFCLPIGCVFAVPNLLFLLSCGRRTETAIGKTAHECSS